MFKCQKMVTKMLSRAACDERRKASAGFTNKHLECQGCPGPKEISGDFAMEENMVYKCPKDPTKNIATRGACVARSRNEQIPDCFGCPGPKKVMQNTVPPSPPTPKKEPVKTMAVKCKFEGCDKELRTDNSAGYCRKHASYGQKSTPMPCKAPSCQNMTKGYGTTGLCTSCACKENAKKSRSPESEKKRIATLKANKAAKRLKSHPVKRKKKKAETIYPKNKICAEHGCDYVLHHKNKHGYCKEHSRGKYTLPKKTTEASAISIDFTDFPEILSALRAAAKDEIRSPENQALYILKNKLANKPGVSI